MIKFIGEGKTISFEKFNPYHDARGRFSTSNGAMSFTYKPGVSRAHDLAIAREKERHKATEAGEANNKKISDAEGKLRTMLADGAIISLKGIDPDLADDVVGSYELVLNKYPGMKPAFTGIEAVDSTHEYMKENTLACCLISQGKIFLNKAYYGDKGKLASSYQKDVDSQFHPKGTDYRAIVTHEIGHAIDGYVSRKIDGMWGVMGTSPTTSADIWNTDIKKKVITNGKSITDGLSRYGSKNAAEYIAEGFAEFMHSSSPRPMAKSIGRRLTNRINKATNM